MAAKKDPPPYQQFAEDLRAFRLAAGLSVAECALKGRMSERSLRNLEAGTQRPNLSTIGNLAAALDVPEERLNRSLLAAPADELFSEPELERLADLIAERLAPRLRDLLR